MSIVQMLYNNGHIMHSPFIDMVELPNEYWVYDFTRRFSEWDCPYDFQIGRYDETRPGMYETELFKGERNHHVGIDIGAPVGTPIRAFTDGKVHSFAYEKEEGGYGNLIITQHNVKFPDEAEHEWAGKEKTVWVLCGHLSSKSIENIHVGKEILAGETYCWMGDRHENGNWEPHVHIQITFEEPIEANMPGVVNIENREEATEKYPDPRIILGDLY